MFSYLTSFLPVSASSSVSSPAQTTPPPPPLHEISPEVVRAQDEVVKELEALLVAKQSLATISSMIFYHDRVMYELTAMNLLRTLYPKQMTIAPDIDTFRTNLHEFLSHDCSSVEGLAVCIYAVRNILAHGVPNTRTWNRFKQVAYAKMKEWSRDDWVTYRSISHHREECLFLRPYFEMVFHQYRSVYTPPSDE